MPLILNPRFALVLLLGLPILGGVTVDPKMATAFVMGAWAGVLIVVPPLFITLWVLRLKTIGDLLAPLMRLPILLALSVAFVYVTGAEVPLALQGVGAAAMLWWMKRSAGLF